MLLFHEQVKLLENCPNVSVRVNLSELTLKETFFIIVLCNVVGICSY